MLLLAGLIFAAACTGSPDAPSAEETPVAAGSPRGPSQRGGAPDGPPGPPPSGGAAPDLDQGQQHPPLPADNPVWDWDAGGFVPEHGWYGEHSWADVRMRVAGHISAAGRDKARLLAEQGDLAGAAAAYRDLVGRLDALTLPEEGVARQIGELLRAAAARDAATLEALAAGTPPPLEGEGLALQRRAFLHQAARVAAGEAVDKGALTSIQEAALAVARDPRPDLDIASFEDFDSRHELRVALFAAYLDSLDPLGLDEPWGYWTAEERRRQGLALFLAARALGGDMTLAADDPLQGEFVVGDLASLSPSSPPLRLPSLIAQVLRAPDQAPHFTAEGLGWLPTGDSLIDVGAEPGPIAIGTLEELGLDDAAHKARLAEQAAAMNEALAADPAAVVPLVTELAATFDAMGHGSRYYNVKQARNEGVRQLARAGRADLALPLLRANRPLHNQDWACPNRVGILEALEGRLLAEAGDKEAALAMLDQSLASSAVFLDQVGQAERLGPRAEGNRPPQMGGGGQGPCAPGAQGGRAPGRPPGTPPPRGGSRSP